MQKKTTILIIVIILFLIGGGVYWWWENQEKEPKTSLEPVDYIQIKETPEGKIVENTKEGVSMKVPEGWEVQLPTSEQEPVMLWGPTYMKCKIESGVENLNLSLEELREKLSHPSEDLLAPSETFREAKIITLSNNQKAVQEDVVTEEFGFFRTVEIPQNNKVYWFTIFPTSEEERQNWLKTYPNFKENKVNCFIEFEKVINSLSFEK